MERVVVIEVADPHGRVVERFRTNHFPVRIGRAYDNDLIITDPYVCPHHCEVVMGEGGAIVVNDLASVNGTYSKEGSQGTGPLTVGADSQLRIGHTTLHFKFPGQAVAATRVDTAVHTPWEWPPHAVALNVAVLLAGALLMTLWDYLESYTEFRYGQYFFGQQIPALIAVAVWAAIWSIVSRITAQRFAFLGHATILVSSLLVMAASDYILEFMKFGFASYWPFEIINIMVITLAIAWLLYWHLRLCSEQKRSRLMIVASVIAVVFVGLVQTNDYLDNQDFRSSPNYSTSLKPPAFQMVNSKAVDDFLGNTDLLREKIGREMASSK